MLTAIGHESNWQTMIDSMDEQQRTVAGEPD